MQNNVSQQESNPEIILTSFVLHQLVVSIYYYDISELSRKCMPTIYQSIKSVNGTPTAVIFFEISQFTRNDF
ncbi:CLUMA_CG015592, isoform A [Clunio marinus]|uniref:CLUMA_CG015592, isoform A n=1 Tax=Clunio marinus TaxID=568069 RepID=A0A1J1IP90_9DIPT|nr:CLUMA_CG015592, isoform A [Clunio marinus]